MLRSRTQGLRPGLSCAAPSGLMLLPISRAACGSSDRRLRRRHRLRAYVDDDVPAVRFGERYLERGAVAAEVAVEQVIVVRREVGAGGPHFDPVAALGDAGAVRALADEGAVGDVVDCQRPGPLPLGRGDEVDRDGVAGLDAERLAVLDEFAADDDAALAAAAGGQDQEQNAA